MSNPLLNSHYAKKRKIIIRILLAIIIVSLFAFGLLSFGNPQWNKYIYMFQCYVYPTSGSDEFTSLIPKDLESYTGTWRHWEKDGILTFEGYYKNGKLDGYRRTWYDNGTKQKENYYIDGKPDGRQLAYYPNGTLMGESYYEHGYIIGTQRAWYENGEKKLQFNYDKGQRHGKQTRWDKEGNIISEKWYYLGTEVTEEEFKASVAAGKLVKEQSETSKPEEQPDTTKENNPEAPAPTAP